MKVSSPLTIQEELLKENIEKVIDLLENESIKVLVGVDKIQEGRKTIERGRYSSKTFSQALKTFYPHLKYRSYKEEVYAIESLENCWGTYLVLHNSLEKRFLTEKNVTEGKKDLVLSEREEEFIQMYSLYCGCLIGLDFLKKKQARKV